MLVGGIVIFLLVAAFLFYASWDVKLGFYLRSICDVKGAKGSIALSYDDGVDPDLTPPLLELLDAYGAKASFCIIGDKAEKYPEIVRDISRRGHTIVNHSMHHKASFPCQCTSRIYQEIMECQRVLESITGKQIKYFRPPYGVTNPMIAKAVQRAGLSSLAWSIRSFDTIGHSACRVARRVNSQIKGRGDIILLHDNRAGVVEITTKILEYIKDKGYRALSIDELLEI